MEGWQMMQGAILRALLRSEDGRSRACSMCVLASGLKSAAHAAIRVALVVGLRVWQWLVAALVVLALLANPLRGLVTAASVKQRTAKRTAARLKLSCAVFATVS